MSAPLRRNAVPGFRPSGVDMPKIKGVGGVRTFLRRPGPLDDGLHELKCFAGDAAPPHDGSVGGDVREFLEMGPPY